MVRHLLLCFVALATMLGGACSSSPESQTTPEPQTAAAEASPAVQISWPEVTAVLDGTDLIEIDDLGLVPFVPAEAAGKYSSEQGGSMLSLTVTQAGETLDVERGFQEPGIEAHSKRYAFPTVNSEGAASAQQDAFLKQTSEGLLLLEQSSGLDSIPATYWVHYIKE